MIRTVLTGRKAVDADVSARKTVTAIFPRPFVRQDQLNAKRPDFKDLLLFFKIDLL